MSRVIQLLSHNEHLFALTDTGEIYCCRQNPAEDCWTPVGLPACCLPPRFSLPEQCDPAPCQASPTDLSSPGSFFTGDKQSEDRLNREHVIPESERMHKLIPDPMFGCPSMETTWVNPNVRRRPTSIGSDGNYMPNREPVHAVKAIGWCVESQNFNQFDGRSFYNGFLGFIYSDGSAGVVDRHVSSSESFAKFDIESKIQFRDSGLKMNWIGLVQESDERLKPFENPEF